MSRTAPHLTAKTKQLHEFAVELARITVSGNWRDAVKSAGQSPFFANSDACCTCCGSQTGRPRNDAAMAMLTISHIQSELDAARLEDARKQARGDA